MGKSGKKPRQPNKPSRHRNFHNPQEEGEEYDDGHEQLSQEEEEEEEEEEEIQEQEVEDEEDEECGGEDDAKPSLDTQSKFHLYQQSVQSPKGDISYLQKFFLMYVGGRVPLHFQEDFCGTALLSIEWLRSDSRRTAVGLDMDLEALDWCMDNNVSKLGADGYSRISLFHGNVLHPLEASLVKSQPQDLIRNITLKDGEDDMESSQPESSMQVSNACSNEEITKSNCSLPARDIICAFNYSCCCLHKRGELVSYFKHVLGALSKRGGIFVMDLYGGTSSECELRLQRKFPNFTYVWEQEEFDIIQRKTRISLHFHLQKPRKKLRHAFSYSWRLWSLPEIKDCLEEAGFESVHFWMRQMPDTNKLKSTVGFGVGRDVKYEEVASFQQEDAWNAYIVGVTK